MAHRKAPDDEPIYHLKAELFRLLGHPARVRVLELLRDGERTVGDLQVALGLDSGGTSQHLTAMRRQGILASRRDGTSVYYRVRDPLMFDLLEVTRRFLAGRLEETQGLLGDLHNEAGAARRATTTRRRSRT